MVYDLRPRGYNTFGRSQSPSAARRGSSSSAPASLRSSPHGTAIILPAKRGRVYLLLAGLAVFTPAAVAALLFTLVVVLLLASATAVADKQIVGVWPPSHAAGFTLAVLLAVCLIVWLAFSLQMMRAYARSQVRRGGEMSAAGEAIRWAGVSQPGVAAVVFFFLVFELGRGIWQELGEYVHSAAEGPLWNLFEGGGAEVLLLFQLLGAAIEALAHQQAERALGGDEVLSSLAPPPIGIWVALGVFWDIVLVVEYFDEAGEPVESNPNRQRARLCAVAGVVKTVGDVIIASM